MGCKPRANRTGMDSLFTLLEVSGTQLHARSRCPSIHGRVLSRAIYGIGFTLDIYLAVMGGPILRNGEG